MIRPSTPRTVIVLSGDEELWVNTGEGSTRHPGDSAVRKVDLFGLHDLIRQEIHEAVQAALMDGLDADELWLHPPRIRAWVNAALASGLDGDQILADAIEGATEDRRAA